MPRKTKDGQPFDQNKYMYDWSKENMKPVGARYKADFVNEFKEACARLGLTQSQVIREAMQRVIDEAKK